jgi:hypothetical protein
MSRRLMIVVLAIAGLLAGAYFMPQVNPFFASSPRINRGEARRVVEQCLAQQEFDKRGFFSDQLFLYDTSGLDYLMGVFGVKPIIKVGREDSRNLAIKDFWICCIAAATARQRH